MVISGFIEDEVKPSIVHWDIGPSSSLFGGEISSSLEEMHIPCAAPAPVQQIGLHDAAATALAAALGNGLSMTDAAALAAAACECVLSAEASHEFVDRTTLGLWLDELAWQLQISDR